MREFSAIWAKRKTQGERLRTVPFEVHYCDLIELVPFLRNLGVAVNVLVVYVCRDIDIHWLPFSKTRKVSLYPCVQQRLKLQSFLVL